MGNTVLTIFDVLNFGILVFLWAFTIKKYKTLPQRIPIHFDFEGKADNFGGKGYSFLMPVMGSVFYIALFFMNAYPEYGNFPFQITEANKDAQFFIMLFFIKWLLMLVLLTFLNIQDYMLRYTLDENSKARIPLFAPIVVIFLSVVTVIIVASQYK